MLTKNILVVDDNLSFRRRFARSFADRGYQVGEAETLIEACDYIKNHQKSYVVLDLKLEKESGLDILRELKKIDHTTRIIVLTGYGTISTAVEALKLGAENYLTKPVDTDTVLRAFSEINSENQNAVPMPKLEQVEWEHINRVIEETQGNITRAAKILGLHRRSLQRKIAKNPNKLK